MATMDLKVRIIPDIAQLKKAFDKLTNGNAGTGAGGKADKPSKESKQILGTMKSIFKLVGIIALGALLISTILRAFEPIIKLLGVVLALLLLPLIPIMKPIMIALGELAKSMAGVAGDFLAGDIGLGEFIGQMFAEIAGFIVDIIPIVLDAFLILMDSLAEAIPVIVPALADAIVAVINSLINFLPDFIEAIVTIIEALIPFIPLLIDGFVKVIEALIPLIPILIPVFVSLIEALIPLIPVIVPALVDAFVAIIEAILPFIPQIVTALISAFNQIIVNLGKSLFSSSIFGKGRGKGETNVSDAIIRPNGQIIRTDPADTLIATKNPGELGGGGGSFVYSPTININGSINSQLDIQRIAEQIAQIGADKLSRKTGSLRF